MSMEMIFVIDAAAIAEILLHLSLTTRRCPCSLSDVTFWYKWQYATFINFNRKYLYSA